ncbi:protein FAR-RED IMPAIRED RESPONSE 1-like [Mercurialis annua]|uniref:protein FAR-RED IMPAIRED RESPONSE 1-like n=1 Tax=Mercurialis annua TaxID=3986 RepID=UPI0024AF0666|nr:protein FAR-RED IMPAIRED RESPONSE 1-like [Mercurialis annua]
MSCLMVGHRSLTINLKRQLEANDIAGVRPSKSVRMLQVQAGGPNNIGCLPKDCRNFIESRRRLRLGEGDAEAIRKLFMTMQQHDRNFFHLMDVNDEGRLVNVLWIHPRGRAAYEEFHDVVSFDTTYLVNKYNMPFATFIGVNQFCQSILLGCALLTHENISSFKWLFMNWLEAMGNVHPFGILTDQCESIKAAVREVMPNTIHRYCIWHILHKLPQKFKNLANFHNAITEFKDIIYHSLTIDLFKMNWNNFVAKHQLENHEWMLDLYSQRESWVPVYLNHHFWAGMASTQRSEGMHAFFDGYIHSTSTLKQFVEQYEIAISDKIQKEFTSDFDSKNRTLSCISDFEWEKQFQLVYTNEMFTEVQAEIKRSWYCHVIPPDDDQAGADEDEVGIEKLNILERPIANNRYHKEFMYTVEFRENGEYLNCNCKKFEFRGIPCCHIFKVMATKDISLINDRYILRRWRKDVYRPHSKIVSASGYPHMTDEYKKYQEAERLFQDCTDLALNESFKMEFIKGRLEILKNDLLKMNDGISCHGVDINGVSTGTRVENDEFDRPPVLDPNVVRSRGRPKSNRLRSRHEQNTSSRNNRRATNGSQRGRRRKNNARTENTTELNEREEQSVDLNQPVIDTQGSQVI